MAKLQLTLYDLVAYLVPGVVALWIVGVLLKWVSGESLRLSGASDWVNGVIFLAAAYFVGHVVQAVGNRIEPFLFHAWGGYPSQRLLMGQAEWEREFTHRQSQWDNRSRPARLVRYAVLRLYPHSPIRGAHYSESLRNQIIGSATDYFALDAKARPQEIFDLCYSLIVAEGVPSLVPVFNAFFSLYRGMVVVCLTCGATLLSGAVVSAVHPRWQPSPFGTVGALVLAAVFFGLAHLFVGRYRGFGEHFADAVYRTFYVYIRRRATSGDKAHR